MTDAPSGGTPDTDRLLARVREAFEAEARVEQQLAAAREATRLLLSEGWDRVKAGDLAWEDVEQASGLSRSALRGRVKLPDAEVQRRAAMSERKAERDRENTPGRFDPASPAAAARLLGRPVTTVWRHAKAGKLEGVGAVREVGEGSSRRFLIWPPEGGWPGVE